MNIKFLIEFKIENAITPLMVWVMTGIAVLIIAIVTLFSWYGSPEQNDYLDQHIEELHPKFRDQP